jgi:hypothetical protein
VDNLGSHKGHAIRAAIRTAKAKLFFLPAYSPDLNPIEQAFAKMKTLPRKADARTVDDTWRTIGALLDCFTPTECANCFKNQDTLQPNHIALFSATIKHVVANGPPLVVERDDLSSDGQYGLVVLGRCHSPVQDHEVCAIAAPPAGRESCASAIGYDALEARIIGSHEKNVRDVGSREASSGKLTPCKRFLPVPSKTGAIGKCISSMWRPQTFDAARVVNAFHERAESRLFLLQPESVYLLFDDAFDPWIKQRTSISRFALERKKARSLTRPTKASNCAKQR